MKTIVKNLDISFLIIIYTSLKFDELVKIDETDQESVVEAWLANLGKRNVSKTKSMAEVG